MIKAIIFFAILAAAIISFALAITLRPVAEIPRCYADMRAGYYPRVECP